MALDNADSTTAAPSIVSIVLYSLMISSALANGWSAMTNRFSAAQAAKAESPVSASTWVTISASNWLRNSISWSNSAPVAALRIICCWAL